MRHEKPFRTLPNQESLKKVKLFAAKTNRSRDRCEDSYIRYAFEELKIVKSFADLKALYQKTTYFMSRVVFTRDRSTRVPPDLQIEPTNYCNVDCITCPSSRSSRKRGYMDFALFQRIVDDASQIGVKRISLSLHGEPTLHPQIVEMISYIKSKDLQFNLTTNGTLFSRQKIEAILRAGVNSGDHITFSVFGHSKEVHEGIVRGGNYEKEVKSIFEFLELRNKFGMNGPVLETVYHTMPENEHEEQQYIKHWRGVVDHARLGGKISVSFSEYKREGKPIEKRTQTCGRIWETMPVFWDGDVTICSHDVDGEWVFGNLREHSISELWHRERLSAIREIHKQRRFEEFPLCIRCDQ